MSTTFTMRIDDGQKALISEYAAIHGKSMAEFDKNPLIYGSDEIMREFTCQHNVNINLLTKPHSSE